MSDKKTEKLSKEELYKLLCDTISHDPVMTRCVLGDDFNIISNEKQFYKLRPKKYPLIKWMGNLVSLSGAFLYSKFNQWCTESGADSTDRSIPNAVYLKRLLAGIQDAKNFPKASAAIRVLRVLDGLYDSFDMNSSVIKYIITNSQLEAGYNTRNRKRCGLAKLIGFPSEESFLVTCDPLDHDEPFSTEGQNLAEAFYYITVFRNDPDFLSTFSNNEIYNPTNIECAFADVLKTMEFMKRVKLDIDSEGNVNFIENAESMLEIPSNGVVKIFETDNGKCKGIYKSKNDLPDNYIIGFYLLERVTYHLDDKTAKAALNFTYQSFDEKDTASVCFTEKGGTIPINWVGGLTIMSQESVAECYKKTCGYLPGTRAASSFFRGMLTAHYRYHNILAPSIVDAIDDDRDAKVRILREFVRTEDTPFKETFEPVFKSLEYALEGQFPNDWKQRVEKLCEYIHNNRYKRMVDWDTLMARILIYEGPTKIFETILLYDDYFRADDKDRIKEIGDNVIAGLEMRYIDSIFEASDVSKKQDDIYKSKEGKVAEYKALFPGHGIKMDCQVLAQSYIDVIVQELTNLDVGEKKDIVSNKFAENNINDSLVMLDSCLDSYKEEPFSKNVLQNAEKAFVQMIVAFLSFYAGISESCKKRLEYEFEKSMKILPSKEIEEHREKIDKAFEAGVTQKASELFAELKDGKGVEFALTELYNFAANSADDAKLYKAVLARSHIDAVALKKIYSVDNGTLVFVDEREKLSFEQVVEEGRLIEYLRRILGFLNGEYILDRRMHKRSYDKSNYTEYKEYAKRVVYPQIVTFAKRSEDCDSNSCLIIDHSGAFAGWNDNEVQILTEFKYKINHAYYALPNLNRVETEWWVEPLLVSCFEFDNILKNKLKEKDIR